MDCLECNKELVGQWQKKFCSKKCCTVHSGRLITPEQKAYRAKRRAEYPMPVPKGSKLPESHKKKIGLANKGKKLSKERVEAMRLFSTGRKLSDETKEKMRVAHFGRTYKPWSIETRIKRAKLRKPKSDIRLRIRACREYKIWRKNIFERDNYTYSDVYLNRIDAEKWLKANGISGLKIIEVDVYQSELDQPNK